MLSAFNVLGKSKPDLMRFWQAEEAATVLAAGIERARDWLTSTASAADEALARLLVAGAAAGTTANDAPKKGAAA